MSDYDSGSDVSPQSMKRDGKYDDIVQRWIEISRSDSSLFIPKYEEYGANDLVVIGAGMVGDMSDLERAEAGCAFYLLGKSARLVEAFRDGRQPSDDTWLDAATYAMMGRLYREGILD